MDLDSPSAKLAPMRESGFFKGSFGQRKLAHNRPASRKQMELPPIGVGINYGTITGRGAGGARFFGEGVVNLLGASGSSTYCPFTIRLTTKAGTIGGSGGVEVSLSPGTVNGIMPGNNMQPKPLNEGGASYVVVKCTSDGKVVVSAQWDILKSPPTATVATIDVAPTTFDVLVGIIADSVVSRVIPCANIVAQIVPSIQTDRVSYLAGQRNYNQYYNWAF